MSDETQTVSTESTNGEQETTLLGAEVAEETTEQPKPEGEQQNEEKKPDPNTVPEKYEVKLPEGVQLDNAVFEHFSGVAKDAGLTQEQFQKLFDGASKLSQDSEKKTTDQYKAVVDDWGAQTKKELGSNLQTELTAASKAVAYSGGKELQQLLNQTGLGNHPTIVKAFAKLGKSISEDMFVEGKSGVQGNKNGLSYEKSPGLK